MKKKGRKEKHKTVVKNKGHFLKGIRIALFSYTRSL